MGITGTNIPQIPNVPRGLDPEVEKFLTKLKEAVEIAFGKSNRGSPLDRFVTVRELENAGLSSMALKKGTELVYRFDDLQSKNRDHANVSLLWPKEG